MKAVFLVMAVLNILLFIYFADRTAASQSMTGKAVLSIIYFGMFLMWILEFVSSWLTSRRRLSEDEIQDEYRATVNKAIKGDRRHWRDYIK